MVSTIKLSGLSAGPLPVFSEYNLFVIRMFPQRICHHGCMKTDILNTIQNRNELRRLPTELLMAQTCEYEHINASHAGRKADTGTAHSRAGRPPEAGTAVALRAQK